MCQAPYPDLKQLRYERVHYDSLTVSGVRQPHLPDLSGKQIEIIAVIEPGSFMQFGLDVLLRKESVMALLKPSTVGSKPSNYGVKDSATNSGFECNLLPISKGWIYTLKESIGKPFTRKGEEL